MKRNLSFIGILVLSFSYAHLAYCYAISDSQVPFEISGEVQASTCEISTDEQYMTIKLGNIVQNTLLDGGHSTPVPFSISLNNCTEGIDNMKIQMHPVSGYDYDDPTIIKLSASAEAKNVGITINYQNKPLNFSESSSGAVISVPIINQQGNADFTAFYRGINNDIGLGTAPATVVFSVDYY